MRLTEPAVPEDKVVASHDGLIPGAGVDERNDFSHEAFRGAQEAPAAAPALHLGHDVVDGHLRDIYMYMLMYFLGVERISSGGGGAKGGFV